MLTSLAFIFLAGLLMAAVCKRLKLPGMIGMLITGIVLGPYVLDLLDPSILSVSSDLRQMALIIILLKAGLSLDLSDLKKVGRPAIMMSCVPASCEILAFFLLAPSRAGGNTHRGGSHGSGAGCGIACGSGAQNGAAHGRKIRHEKKHTSAYSCRSFLR